MKLERLQIPSGANTLSALHYLPASSPRPVSLLYTHGFTAGKYSMDSLAAYLAGKGYQGLAFDIIGHKSGASTGKFVTLLFAWHHFFYLDGTAMWAFFRRSCDNGEIFPSRLQHL